MTSQVKFHQSGSSIFVQKISSETTFDRLKPQVYSVNFNPLQGYSLNIDKPNFTLPSKIFGSSQKRAERVITTYEDRNKSTGVLLTGDKGSGKTLLTQLVCNKMIEKGVPVLIIEEQYYGQDFFGFLDNIGECVIVIDEFGKKYPCNVRSPNDSNPQNALLSLMDGTISTKRLMLLTENQKNNISDYIISRPGRVYYHWEYDKLEKCAIEEYCEHMEVPKNITLEAIDVANSCYEFSFDILVALIEEYKRYEIGPLESWNDINIDRFNVKRDKYALVDVVNQALENQKVEFIPLTTENIQDFSIQILEDGEYSEEDDIFSGPKTASSDSSGATPNTRKITRNLYLDYDDMVYDTGEIKVFTTEQKYLVTFKKMEKPQIRYNYNTDF